MYIVLIIKVTPRMIENDSRKRARKTDRETDRKWQRLNVWNQDGSALEGRRLDPPPFSAIDIQIRNNFIRTMADLIEILHDAIASISPQSYRNDVPCKPQWLPIPPPPLPPHPSLVSPSDVLLFSVYQSQFHCQHWERFTQWPTDSAELCKSIE